MEILKQSQYHPVDVASQVMLLYAASGGYMDDVPPEDIAEFEKQYQRYMEEHEPGRCV